MTPNSVATPRPMDTKKEDTKADVQVFETTDYGMFKGIIGNRPLYEPHLGRLVTSIQEKNLLQYNPIQVNEKYEVIDGQHRLMAAKALSLPIFYIVIPDAGLFDVQTLNVNNRAWTLDDFLDSFVARGIRDYILLQDFTEEYNLSIAIAINILSDKYDERRRVKEDFKRGKFRIKDLGEAQRMGSLVSEIRWYSPDYAWTDRDCMMALKVVLDKIDPKTLIQRLHDYQLTVTRRASKQDYLEELETILNFNQKEKVSLR